MASLNEMQLQAFKQVILESSPPREPVVRPAPPRVCILVLIFLTLLCFVIRKKVIREGILVFRHHFLQRKGKKSQTLLQTSIAALNAKGNFS